MPSTSSLRFIKMCSVLIVTSLYMYSWGLHVRNNNDIVECNGLHWNNLSYNGLSLANYCVLCFTPGVALATHETFNYIPSQRAWRLTGSAQLADLSLLGEVVPLRHISIPRRASFCIDHIKHRHTMKGHSDTPDYANLLYRFVVTHVVPLEITDIDIYES